MKPPKSLPGSTPPHISGVLVYGYPEDPRGAELWTYIPVLVNDMSSCQQVPRSVYGFTISSGFSAGVEAISFGNFMVCAAIFSRMGVHALD